MFEDSNPSHAEAEAETGHSPTISIVLPIYRALGHLDRLGVALAGLESPDREFILVDDGSNDGTLEELRELVRAKSTYKLISLPSNRGPGAARNAGLAVAVGEYVWFPDWDDMWCGEILDVLCSIALEYNADVVACRARWMDASGRLGPTTDGASRRRVQAGDDAMRAVLEGAIKGYLWNKIFRNSLLGADPFPSMRTQEDLVVVARTVHRAQRVVSIPEVLYFHVKRPGSLTNSSQPVLANLETARNEVQSFAEQLTPRTMDKFRRTHFDYAYWYLASVTTAARLSDEATAARVLVEIRSRITVMGLLQVAVIAPVVALKCALIKVLGLRFYSIRTRMLSMRRGFVR